MTFEEWMIGKSVIIRGEQILITGYSDAYFHFIVKRRGRDVLDMCSHEVLMDSIKTNNSLMKDIKQYYPEVLI